MGTEKIIKIRVAFMEGFEHKGETWEDRLEEAKKLRGILPDVFKNKHPDEPEEGEFEIEGAKGYWFGVRLKQYRYDMHMTTMLFGALKEFPPNLTPLMAMNWQDYNWGNWFVSQYRCWFYAAEWEYGNYNNTYLLDPCNNEKEYPYSEPTPSVEQCVSETRSECLIRYAAAGY